MAETVIHIELGYFLCRSCGELARFILERLRILILVSSYTVTKRFVVLMIGRSGSTHLIQRLNSHSEISARGEELAGCANAEKQLKKARRLWTPSLDSKKTVVGFKTKVSDIRSGDGFAKLLRELDVRVISLARQNLVKAAVSLIRSQVLFEKTGKWNLWNESDRVESLSIARDEFATALDIVEMALQTLRVYVQQLTVPVLELKYEDLLYDEYNTMQRVFEFLEIEYQITESRCKKNTADCLREVITNFNDLRSQYTGTRYLEMFDECS